jgi:hypothetical protein
MTSPLENKDVKLQVAVNIKSSIDADQVVAVLQQWQPISKTAALL